MCIVLHNVKNELLKKNDDVRVVKLSGLLYRQDAAAVSSQACLGAAFADAVFAYRIGRIYCTYSRNFIN
jgi:hypothetical protein